MRGGGGDEWGWGTGEDDNFPPYIFLGIVVGGAMMVMVEDKVEDIPQVMKVAIDKATKVAIDKATTVVRDKATKVVRDKVTMEMVPDEVITMAIGVAVATTERTKLRGKHRALVLHDLLSSHAQLVCL